ncbi:IS21 family transposase, partial [Bifidobacterium longum subsp. longum]|nr:IS21 family transposase [Bifidobacterium longum subsp. longum]
GDKPTDSGDPSSQLGLLCDRPAAWRNSRVRDAMPDPLREWIDAQDEATRRDSLRALLHADGESGWRAAVAGMLEILESTGGADRAGVCLAAARHASGLGPVAYDDPVDLSEY